MARRRDRSNELIVAIVVIGTLALALTFGIILSLSSNTENSDIQDTPTAAALRVTPSPTFTPSKTASPTPTTAPKHTLIAVSDTPTVTPTPFGPPAAEAYWPDTNVRTGPSTDEPSVGTIQPGTFYPVLGERARWYLIEFPAAPTGSGWVYSQVVQLSGDPALIPVVTEAESTATTNAVVAAQQTADAVAVVPTPTQTPQATLTPLPTAEPSATPTPEPSPTFTIDAVLIAQQQTADAVAHDLDQTLTAIAVVPTITPSPEPTDTPSPAAEPSATPTPEPSPTPSPTVEPSETLTPEPSFTPSPTETPTATATLTPTATPTKVSTATPRPTATPTDTATPTATPTPTATFTPSNTPTITLTPTFPATLTFTPYPTLTPSVTPFAGEQTATPSASGCLIPENWIKFVIQPGNTMFGLARQFGLTVDELAAANCIEHPNNITSGQILYVPPGSNVTLPTPGTITAPLTGNYASFDCGDPSWTITQPKPGTVLRGTFAVYGTATHPQFSFYRLQISGSGTNDADFATVQVYQTPVTNGELGTINTAAFAPGDYWLRLTVVDITGNYPPQCTVRVRFEP